MRDAGLMGQQSAQQQTLVNARYGSRKEETTVRELGRVLGQRRDTPDNEKWSGRWESNPHGKRFRAFKTSGLVRLRMPSVISV